MRIDLLSAKNTGSFVGHVGKFQMNLFAGFSRPKQHVVAAPRNTSTSVSQPPGGGIVVIQEASHQALFLFLASAAVSDREVMWTLAFIWMLSQREYSLSGAVQWLSVSPFVHVSFKNSQQNELK